jgi:hypothetical protein
LDDLANSIAERARRIQNAIRNPHWRIRKQPRKNLELANLENFGNNLSTTSTLP